MDIPGVPAALIEALVGAAEGTRLALVGGAVRDLLLHHQHRDPWRGLPDLDLVVEGQARDLVARLPQLLPPGSSCSWREHGSFGTVAVELALPQAGTWLLDIASARRETYPAPASNPEVSLGRLEDDLARRDFSVNAIALLLQAAGAVPMPLLDPHHGQEDLERRRLRLLHSDSLVDDPTRLVRAARYAARLDFALDPGSCDQARRVIEAWPWPWRLGDSTQQTPPALGTRLRMELELLLEREPWRLALQHLQTWGGLALLDPGLQRSSTWALALRRAMRLQLPPLAVLVACADDPVALAARLQLPHRQQQWLKGLTLMRAQLAALEPDQRLGWGAAEWTDWLERSSDPAAVVPLALVCGDQPRRPLLRWWLLWRHVQPAQSARDLLAEGVPPGPALGARLRELRAQRLNALEPMR
jgi:poly(A) polymerase